MEEMRFKMPIKCQKMFASHEWYYIGNPRQCRDTESMRTEPSFEGQRWNGEAWIERTIHTMVIGDLSKSKEAG